MADTTEQVKGVEMNLSELIAGMIQSTIDADQAVTDDYLEAFTQYAFTPQKNGHAKLIMVDFEMTDSEGRRQVVSIPKLSLLPLPVLHVSEATFDFEAQLSIKERKTTDTTAKPALTTSDLMRRRNLLARNLMVNIAVPKAKATSDTKETEQNINMKVHIKLQPTQLPNGMRGMLQESDSSMQVTGIE